MICAICGERVDDDWGYYEVESNVICFDCACSSCREVLERLGFSCYIPAEACNE